MVQVLFFKNSLVKNNWRAICYKKLTEIKKLKN